MQIEIIPNEGEKLLSNQHKVLVVDKYFKKLLNLDRHADPSSMLVRADPAEKVDEWDCVMGFGCHLDFGLSNEGGPLIWAALSGTPSLFDGAFLRHSLEALCQRMSSRFFRYGEATACWLPLNPVDSYGVVTIPDVVCDKMGVTCVKAIRQKLPGIKNAIDYGDFLNLLAKDSRTRPEDCFRLAIQWCDLLATTYMGIPPKAPDAKKTEGNRETLLQLASGICGGPGAILSGRELGWDPVGQKWIQRRPVALPQDEVLEESNKSTGAGLFSWDIRGVSAYSYAAYSFANLVANAAYGPKPH